MTQKMTFIDNLILSTNNFSFSPSSPIKAFPLTY